ncbi:HSP20-like chaperone [Apodospora peruviana]|uniref:HSP20-like chaperone n=1 Tax=Apodospora peruviana TaxID=516989 RepID=A0AAE0MF66_9PEZI|nr:HSP20-like chaperone [Apodospora peruviana]
MFNAFADHPFARGLREHVGNPWVAATQQQERSPAAAANPQQEKEDDDNDETFVPPIDIFNTSNSWTLHVAIPGAKKEDVDVNFDADRSTLTVSGLVYRPGDEAFLRGLISGERMVGLFERKVQLPPPTTAAVQAGAHEQEKEEVDADNITAKMEDGILIVVVPKLEKEWTEVKKVDIE